MILRKLYRFPVEPSIVGFIFYSSILGIFTSSNPTLVNLLIVIIINFHLIFTIDSVYQSDRVLSISSIYGILSNSILIILIATYDIEIFYSIVPAAILLFITLLSKSIYGRRSVTTTLIGTSALTSLTLPFAAITGGTTYNTFIAWIVYTSYVLTSLAYVESCLRRLNTTISLISSLTLIPIYFFLNPLFSLIAIDPLAKTFTLHISKSFVDNKEITRLGIIEMIRLTIHVIMILVIIKLL